jgi:hypothetical protein
MIGFRILWNDSLSMSEEWRSHPTGFQPLWERPGICRTAFDMLPRFERDVQERLKNLLAKADDLDLISCWSMHRRNRLRLVGAHGRWEWMATQQAAPRRRGFTLTQEGAPDRFRRWFPIRMRAIRARELAQLGLTEESNGYKMEENPLLLEGRKGA